MPNRTERRAAERKALKLANKELRQNPQAPIAQSIGAADFKPLVSAEFKPEPAVRPKPSPISQSQLTANRANALRAHGPLTPNGKAISSLNAIKHGLTSRTVILAGEDSVEYDLHLNSCIQDLQPANKQELRLVQSLVDCNWRLDRIQKIESAIYFKGSLEFADKFGDQPPAHRECLILAEVYLKYEKSLRNLNIQESRLLRTLQKAQAELQLLQKARHREDQLASESQSAASSEQKNGFVFANAGNDIPHNLDDHEEDDHGHVTANPDHQAVQDLHRTTSPE